MTETESAHLAAAVALVAPGLIAVAGTIVDEVLYWLGWE